MPVTGGELLPCSCSPHYFWYRPGCHWPSLLPAHTAGLYSCQPAPPDPFLLCSFPSCQSVWYLLASDLIMWVTTNIMFVSDLLIWKRAYLHRSSFVSHRSVRTRTWSGAVVVQFSPTHGPLSTECNSLFPQSGNNLLESQIRIVKGSVPGH